MEMKKRMTFIVKVYGSKDKESIRDGLHLSLKRMKGVEDFIIGMEIERSD